jgi:hypothetical protein
LQVIILFHCRSGIVFVGSRIYVSKVLESLLPLITPIDGVIDLEDVGPVGNVNDPVPGAIKF